MSPRLAIRTCRWLYNYLGTGVIIIDVRTSEDFSFNTLITAINIPPSIRGASSMMEIEKLMHPSNGFTCSKINLRDIVIVGDNTAANNEWRDELQELLIADRTVMSVNILQESFLEFQSRYPFYTTTNPGDIVTINRMNYPNEIIDEFLYLGNMWQASSIQIIQDLGITHIINSTLDIGNLFENRNIQYLNVEIQDVEEADISSHFDRVFEFIKRALDENSLSPTTKQNRVFVHCSQGISRSATLVIMFLMRLYQWTLVKAFNFTQQGRPVIIPNNGFFRALLQEERCLFNNRTSLSESQIDQLLLGQLVDQNMATIPPEKSCSRNCYVM